MIFSEVLQLFLFFSGQWLPTVLPQPGVEAAAAAATPAMETVEGYEDSLQLPYKFRLPAISDQPNFGPRRKESDSLGVLTTSRSALVVDERTWSVLYDQNSNHPQPIASISKLMSALVLLDQGLDMKKQITISKADYRPGGVIHLFPSEIFLTQDVWMDGLIASDNVAIEALVRSVGLSEDEFVVLMNKKAAALGMTKTNFHEATGISELNTSTASDIARLVSEAMKHVEITDAVRRPVYTFQARNKKGLRKIVSTDQLLSSFINKGSYRVLGGKTGFTDEAGYCLAVMVDGPNPADNVVVVLLGANTLEDRFLQVKGLVDWVYANYAW